MLKKLFRRIRRIFREHPRKAWGGVAVVLLAYAFCLPRPLFDKPVSLVIEDEEGALLGARIATDCQWRFPMQDSLPDRFVKCLVEFEDRRFYYHPGVDPAGLARALVQNIRNRGVVSGGSTITMQVIRMARDNPPRNLWQKAIEMIMATRLELGCSKSKILRLYAANAPFGGNVVGLEAACWRYFGKQPALLSWSEAATMAVLPNAPALIHPGRNRQALLEKRNRLLDRLLAKGAIDSLTCELAKEEELPQAPLPLPSLAPQLLDRIEKENMVAGKSRFRTTLRKGLQQQAWSVLERHHAALAANGVHNLAAVIIDIQANEVVAYLGNAPNAGAEHGEQVDVITAPRSTGSIMKPFLYASALQEGLIVPNSLLPDVPTSLSGYRPENFHEKYDGAVVARRALIRSLNVPFVNLLQDYGLPKFHHKLKQLGMTSLVFPPDHYGLTLVLGGAEGKLWDLTNIYAGMSRTLGHFYDYDGRYNPADFRFARYLAEDKTTALDRDMLLEEPPYLGAAAIYYTFDAMQELERPNAEGEWERFSSGRRIAWKTGTSFGFRDAWAIGVTPRYAVGVWAGNADGEGRPGLIGVLAAAPVLFDLFNILPAPPSGVNRWFDQPYDDMERQVICRHSGYKPLAQCPVDTVYGPVSARNLKACPYCRIVHLDHAGRFQVTAECEPPDRMQHVPWFVLPPLEEFYYKSKNPQYQPLPPFVAGCDPGGDSNPMELIYPKQPTRILVPVDLDGKLSRTVFSVAHRRPETAIYWHIDGEYIGCTVTFHSMELNPPEGKHILTLVDADGRRLVQPFEILKK